MILMIGYSIWWMNAPEQILQAPWLLPRPDLSELIQIVKDTFLNNVCHEHQVPSPCECGEIVNSVAQEVLGQDISPSEIRSSRARSFATMFMGLVIALLLAKNSIPTEGLELNTKWFDGV